MSRIVVAGVVLLGLAACAAPQRRASPMLNDARLSAMSERAQERQKTDPAGPAMRRMLSNRTRVTMGGGHGVQVSYATPDGRIYLWYPGNREVLAGRWRIVESNAVVRTRTSAYEFPQTRVCFDYGMNSYNPVTRKSGEECMHAAIMKMFAGQSVAGDRFGLSRRKAVPHVLKPTDRIDLGAGSAGGR
ncbi:hypothetical protein ACFONL_06800 [Camelimonas fluminis]|uniref:Uncharacterized protein n=2 Tax=Camelimonas fluminis TaxID=1576911 RepID=A0ABV7UEH3_9HYPH